MQRPSLVRNRFFVAFLFVLVVVVVPAAYVSVVNSLETHAPLQFDAGWSDPSFSRKWIYAANTPAPGYLETASPVGVLSIYVNQTLQPNNLVAAQTYSLPPINVSWYLYLVMSIRTPSLGVAARVVLWVDSNHAVTVLTKTYPDRDWHTEVIDLSQFLLFGEQRFFMLELSAFVIEQPASYSPLISYRGVMIAEVPGGLV